METVLYGHTGKFLGGLDANNYEIKKARFESLASDPASPQYGRFYVNSASNILKIYTNVWKLLVATDYYAFLFNPATEANTLFVHSDAGNDATAQIGNKEKMYATLTAANTAASSGDTVVILKITGTINLTPKAGVKYVGVPDFRGNRPTLHKLLDGNVAATGWKIKNIDFLSTSNAGIFYIENSATEGELENVDFYSDVDFWGGYNNGKLSCVVDTVKFLHTGTASAIENANGALISGMEIVDSPNSYGFFNYGILNNVKAKSGGQNAFYNASSGHVIDFDGTCNYTGAACFYNLGKAEGVGRRSVARSTAQSGFINLGVAKNVDGYGNGNGVRGVGAIKGTGFENGGSNVLYNVGVYAEYCRGFSETDEGFVDWPLARFYYVYGEAAAGALEGLNLIGAIGEHGTGKSYSTLENAADVSIQNGDIPAHGLGYYPCKISNVTAISNNAIHLQAVFMQGNGHELYNCTFVSLAGKPALNMTGGSLACKFFNCTMVTDGLSSIVSDTGSATEIYYYDGSHTPFGAEIINIAFDAESRADFAARTIYVTASNIWGTPEERIAIAELSTQGGTIYSAGGTFDVVVQVRGIGGDYNTSVRYRISKASTQDAHAGNWKIELLSEHFATNSILLKSFQLKIYLKDQDFAYLVLEKAAGTDPGANVTLGISVFGLEAQIPLLGAIVQTDNIIFTSATVPAITETVYLSDKYLTPADAGNTYAAKSEDVWTPNFFNVNGISPSTSPIAGSFYHKNDKQVRAVFNTSFTADVSGADVSFSLTLPVNRSASYPNPGGDYTNYVQLAGSNQHIRIDGVSYRCEVCFFDSANADRVLFRVTNTSLSLSAVTVSVAAQIDYISA